MAVPGDPARFNVVLYPPRPHTALHARKAIRKAIESYPEDLNVVIFGDRRHVASDLGPAGGADQQQSTELLGSCCKTAKKLHSNLLLIAPRAGPRSDATCRRSRRSRR